ncbi:hypothetical protein BFJ70_g17761, partial [Fusarium oxysporum]
AVNLLDLLEILDLILELRSALPVSPILFLLYTEPIYRLSNPQGRFGYADDTAILCVGDTVEETAAAASRSVEEMVRWGAANGVSFDPKKTEVMHFSRSKLETAPAIRHGDVEKHPEAAMRWLGIWLDSSLSFRVHAEKWTAKSQAVAYHLRGLTNTARFPALYGVPSGPALNQSCSTAPKYGTQGQPDRGGSNRLKTGRQVSNISCRE